MTARLKVSHGHWQQMIDHARACLPEEACGILGGKWDQVEVVIAITNELHLSGRFRMAPEEQVKAFCQLEEMGMDLIGLFHSHPNGPGEPSPLDLKEFAYPGVPVVVCYPVEREWNARGFHIDAGAFREIGIDIEDTA